MNSDNSLLDLQAVVIRDCGRICPVRTRRKAAVFIPEKGRAVQDSGTERTMKQWDVYVFGDVNIDLVIPGVERFPAPGQEDVVETMETFVGGGAALFALGLGKLGLHPVFQGCIGKDFYGEFIKKEFQAKNIDCTLLEQREDRNTGISISFTNEKDRSFLTYRGGNDFSGLSRVRMEDVKKARHFHVTGYEGQRNHEEYLQFLKKLKEETSVTVSFDLGWDPQEEWSQKIYELFPYIDVLFMNETEALHYSRKESVEEAAEEFGSRCGIAAVKMGKEGSLAVKEKKLYRAAAFPVVSVDTTGAGDSFNAGFIYGFLTGREVTDCLRYGNACGALNVTALGGNTAFPNKAELERFLETRKG